MKFRFLILPFFMSLCLNAVLYFKLDQKESIVITKQSSKDSLELATCAHANDSLKKLINQVIDFRHSSHDIQDTIIKKHKKERLPKQ